MKDFHEMFLFDIKILNPDTDADKFFADWD